MPVLTPYTSCPFFCQLFEVHLKSLECLYRIESPQSLLESKIFITPCVAILLPAATRRDRWVCCHICTRFHRLNPRRQQRSVPLVGELVRLCEVILTVPADLPQAESIQQGEYAVGMVDLYSAEKR